MPAEGVFETAEQFFARPRMADAVLICTQDSQHYAYACQAIDLGYSILLEKPISPSARECLDLQRRAEEKGTQIMVCHVILSWLLGSRCRTVSSFGDLRYFREENAPAGSPARCTDGCPHSGSCPYYAPALYLDDNTPWPTALTALGPDQSYEARKKALEEGPYGKCVFHNDNDVVDHQVASLLFENGTTVAFTMCAFSDACDRTVKFMGTRGEIRASMDNNVIEVTQFGAGVRTGTTAVYTVKPGSTGHSGGDEGIMEEFVSILKGERENTNTIAQSVHSHVMAFAAEESRLTGRTVDVADFEKSVMA